MIRINNYARNTGQRDGKDYFEWLIFVDEGKETLGKIEYVEYLLHPTFPNPRRIVADRESRFALKSSGWGEFTVAATIHMKDGRDEAANYKLDLNKKWQGDEGVRSAELDTRTPLAKEGSHEGRGRLFRRKDGKYLLYLPLDLAEDSMFPFKGYSKTKGSIGSIPVKIKWSRNGKLLIETESIGKVE